MKNISLKSKTIILSGIIVILLLAVGGAGIYSVRYLSHSVNHISQQSLPAVRNMTLVDMMHDGVRAVVYRSLISKPEEKADVEEEYKEFNTNITKYLDEINKLEIDVDLKRSIDKAKQNIKVFQNEGEKVVSLALAGNKVGAEAQLPFFIKSFDLLATDLESIGDRIQAQANEESLKSQNDSEKLSQLSLIIVIIGICVSGLISYFAYSFISGLTSGLLQITTGIKTETEMIVETSQTMASVASKLSESATEQAASLQQTVSSVDEISAMVTRNADSASTSAKMAEQTTMVAQKGKEKAEVMMESINAISAGNEDFIRQMQKSNAEISEIVKMIQNIGQKTQVINDIVFQTKLLSFNASVEAARAGEHGKGFAVVAEEVGNLASMSGKAATEITEMLSSSVKQVTDIVDGTKSTMDILIRQSKEKIDTGTITARQCTNALDEILSNFSTLSEMVREIASASKEQSTGVAEVNKAMGELDQVTQSNTGVAQESSLAANGLESQAERLNGLVEELNKMVTGKSSEVSVVKKKESHLKGLTETVKKQPLKKTHRIKEEEVHKIIGIDFEIPKSTDHRFEDI